MVEISQEIPMMVIIQAKMEELLAIFLNIQNLGDICKLLNKDFQKFEIVAFN